MHLTSLSQEQPVKKIQITTTELPLQHIVDNATRIFLVAVLVSTLIVPLPQHAGVSSDVIETDRDTARVDMDTTIQVTPTSIVLKESLLEVLPARIGKLSPDVSEVVSQRIFSTLGIQAYSVLDGNELNLDYGYMGAEQHLPRFPGDTIAMHDEYQSKGITRSTGAFSYFVPSKAHLTDEAIQQEKYYMAVQTFYAPQWSENAIAYKNWIMFRKVLVINPENGRAIVAVVGDAGPARWTGKHFGGSPEVVHYLNDGKHKAKTTTVLFFVDDPDDTVPLGPIT